MQWRGCGSSLPPMTKLARISLKHRRVVVLFWLVVTVVAGFAVSSANSGLSHSVANPGTAGSEATEHIRKRLGLEKRIWNWLARPTWKRSARRYSPAAWDWISTGGQHEYRYRTSRVEWLPASGVA